MISTGIDALDRRIGALRAGSLYAFFGPGSAGKSVMALHFLAEGLARGEECVLLTLDEHAMIDSRAMYLGYMGGRLTEHPKLRVIRMPEELPSRGARRPQEFAAWLDNRLEDAPFSRIVVDNIESLDAYSRAPHEVLEPLMRHLQETDAVGYALVRTERGGAVEVHGHDVLLQHVTGAFQLAMEQRGERSFRTKVAPSGIPASAPFAYSLKIGAGFTEDLPLEDTDLTPEERRRIVVLDEIEALAPEVLASLEQTHEVLLLPRAAGALKTLSDGRYGALVLAVDPFDEARTLDLIFAVRREGNSSPIVCVAPSRGLRSTTRSRGLRVGADDFFVADLQPSEVVERIHVAWRRGSHRRSGLNQIGQIMQPLGADGQARPMTTPELLQAMGTLLNEQPPLFFCYLEFELDAPNADAVWPALRGRLRVGDGDIVGQLPGQRWGCVLDRITSEQTERVIERIRKAHPGLAGIDNPVVIACPLDASRLTDHLGRYAGGVRDSGRAALVDTVGF